MTIAKTAPAGATAKPCLRKEDLITIDRSVLEYALEQLEESLRARFGWQDKASAPIALARVLYKYSDKPKLGHPGLGYLLTAYDTITALSQTPSSNDRSPEGIARLKMALLAYPRPFDRAAARAVEGGAAC